MPNSSLARRKKQKIEPNRFRPIVYSEKELDKSNFMLPPSRFFRLYFDQMVKIIAKEFFSLAVIILCAIVIH